MTCVGCRWRPVCLSWLQHAVIVRQCRRLRLCLDCYAHASVHDGMAEMFLQQNLHGGCTDAKNQK